MSGGQIGIDVNNYQNFILNFELQGVIVIDTAKTRRQRTSLFVIAIRLWNKLPAEIAEWKPLSFVFYSRLLPYLAKNQ